MISSGKKKLICLPQRIPLTQYKEVIASIEVTRYNITKNYIQFTSYTRSVKRSVRLHLLTMQYLPRNAHWIQHSALKIKNNWPSNEKEINLLPHEYPSRLITLFSNYAPTLHKRQTMIVVTRTEGRHVLKVVTVIFNILSSFGNNIDAIEFFFLSELAIG